MIDQIISRAQKLNVKLDSVVIEENGKIQERVINKIDLHELRSCTKLLTAFAYGIAMDKKLECANGGGYFKP